MTERTMRGNGKWAKVSGKRGTWTVAMGWAGQLMAAKVQKWHFKDGAMIAATHWLEY